MTAWEIKGREFGNCNCDYGCPCQFNALPTHGHCRGLAVFDIETGFHGSTRLDGLRAAGIFRWPGPSTRAKARACMSSTDAPRPSSARRCLRILRGEDTEPGATVFQVFASTCDTLHEPIIADIDVRARHRRPNRPRPHRRRGGDARRADPQSGHRGRASCPHRAAERLRVRRGRDRARLVEDARAGPLRARRQLWAIRRISISAKAAWCAEAACPALPSRRCSGATASSLLAALVPADPARLALPARGRRHRHGPVRHERLADAACAAAGAQRRLDASLLARRLLHVGRHDGGDDAALGLAHGAALCPRRAPGRDARAAPRAPPPRSRLSPRAISAVWILFSLLAVAAQWALEQHRRACRP